MAGFCMLELHRPARNGGVAEWFKALVLKTSLVKANVGSNPSPSARN